MSNINKLYQRLIQDCRTINQVNRVHIALENWMTPGAVFEMRAACTKPAPRANTVDGVPTLDIPLLQRDWIHGLYQLLGKSAKRAPEPYLRRPVAGNLALYTLGGDRSGKTLAICFTGAAQRMLMPLPVFLQHIDASCTDVAVVRYARGRGYRNGIVGLGGNLEDSIDRLPGLLHIDKYDRAVSIGTSGGGLPAVMAGLRLGFASAMGIGCNHVRDPRWLEARGEEAGATLCRWVSLRACQTKIFLVYGADYPPDQAAAAGIAQICTQARMLKIASPDGNVGHAALLPMLIGGRLSDFFNSTVFDARNRNRIRDTP